MQIERKKQEVVVESKTGRNFFKQPSGLPNGLRCALAGKNNPGSRSIGTDYPQSINKYMEYVLVMNNQNAADLQAHYRPNPAFSEYTAPLLPQARTRASAKTSLGAAKQRSTTSSSAHIDQMRSASCDPNEYEARGGMLVQGKSTLINASAKQSLLEGYKSKISCPQLPQSDHLVKIRSSKALNVMNMAPQAMDNFALIGFRNNPYIKYFQASFGNYEAVSNEQGNEAFMTFNSNDEIYAQTQKIEPDKEEANREEAIKVESPDGKDTPTTMRRLGEGKEPRHTEESLRRKKKSDKSPDSVSSFYAKQLGRLSSEQKRHAMGNRPARKSRDNKDIQAYLQTNDSRLKENSQVLHSAMSQKESKFSVGGVGGIGNSNPSVMKPTLDKMEMGGNESPGGGCRQHESLRSPSRDSLIAELNQAQEINDTQINPDQQVRDVHVVRDFVNTTQAIMTATSEDPCGARLEDQVLNGESQEQQELNTLNHHLSSFGSFRRGHAPNLDSDPLASLNSQQFQNVGISARAIQIEDLNQRNRGRGDAEVYGVRNDHDPKDGTFEQKPKHTQIDPRVAPSESHPTNGNDDYLPQSSEFKQSNNIRNDYDDNNADNAENTENMGSSSEIRLENGASIVVVHPESHLNSMNEKTRSWIYSKRGSGDNTVLYLEATQSSADDGGPTEPKQGQRPQPGKSARETDAKRTTTFKDNKWIKRDRERTDQYIIKQDQKLQQIINRRNQKTLQSKSKAANGLMPQNEQSEDTKLLDIVERMKEIGEKVWQNTASRGHIDTSRWPEASNTVQTDTIPSDGFRQERARSNAILTQHCENFRKLSKSQQSYLSFASNSVMRKQILQLNQKYKGSHMEQNIKLMRQKQWNVQEVAGTPLQPQGYIQKTNVKNGGRPPVTKSKGKYQALQTQEEFFKSLESKGIALDQKDAKDCNEVLSIGSVDSHRSPKKQNKFKNNRGKADPQQRQIDSKIQNLRSSTDYLLSKHQQRSIDSMRLLTQSRKNDKNAAGGTKDLRDQSAILIEDLIRPSFDQIEQVAVCTAEETQERTRVLGLSDTPSHGSPATGRLGDTICRVPDTEKLNLPARVPGQEPEQLDVNNTLAYMDILEEGKADISRSHDFSKYVKRNARSRQSKHETSMVESDEDANFSMNPMNQSAKLSLAVHTRLANQIQQKPRKYQEAPPIKNIRLNYLNHPRSSGNMAKYNKNKRGSNQVVQQGRGLQDQKLEAARRTSGTTNGPMSGIATGTMNTASNWSNITQHAAGFSQNKQAILNILGKQNNYQSCKQVSVLNFVDVIKENEKSKLNDTQRSAEGSPIICEYEQNPQTRGQQMLESKGIYNRHKINLKSTLALRAKSQLQQDRKSYYNRAQPNVASTKYATHYGQFPKMQPQSYCPVQQTQVAFPQVEGGSPLYPTATMKKNLSSQQQRAVTTQYDQRNKQIKNQCFHHLVSKSTNKFKSKPPVAKQSFATEYESRQNLFHQNAAITSYGPSSVDIFNQCTMAVNDRKWVLGASKDVSQQKLNPGGQRPPTEYEPSVERYPACYEAPSQSSQPTQTSPRKPNQQLGPANPAATTGALYGLDQRLPEQPSEKKRASMMVDSVKLNKAENAVSQANSRTNSRSQTVIKGRPAPQDLIEVLKVNDQAIRGESRGGSSPLAQNQKQKSQHQQSQRSQDIRAYTSSDQQSHGGKPAHEYGVLGSRAHLGKPASLARVAAQRGQLPGLLPGVATERSKTSQIYNRAAK